MKPRIPWVTLLLIAANIVPAFGLLFDPQIADEFGFRPDSPTLLAALTCLFLHLNVVHLMGNMVFLAAVGPSVEFAVGAWRFLVVYLVGGLTGTFAHWLMSRNVENPSLLIGASGAVAACVGYASVRYFGVKVPLSPRLKIPIWSMAAVWALLQVAGAFYRLGDPAGGVAFWSHVGGFFAGVALSVVFRAPASVAEEVDHRALADMSERSPAAVVAAADRILRRNPNDLRALAEKASALADLGEHDQEAEVRCRILERAKGDLFAENVLALAELDRLRLACLGSSRRLREAEALRATHPDAARRLLESLIDGPVDEPLRPDAMLALATLLESSEPAAARSMLRRLDDEYPLHAAADLARAKGLLP